MRLRLLARAVVVAVLLTGCSGPAPNPPSEPAPPSPFQACPPSNIGTSTGNGAVGSALPATTLECFTGGQPVALAGLGTPAVINLWASWCGPCRTELPQLQRFADAAGDRVLVLGVVSGDTWNAAAYAGADFGVSFPAVFDPDEQLRKALGRNAIPITLFVDGSGIVRHVDMSGALTLDELRTLAMKHLGIAV